MHCYLMLRLSGGLMHLADVQRHLRQDEVISIITGAIEDNDYRI